MTLISLGASICIITLALSISMAVAWQIEQRTGNASWIDCGWTCAVGLVGMGAAVFPGGCSAPSTRSLVVCALIAVWSARLARHLLRRALRGIDDQRYAALRSQWGASASRQMFWFAQAQALAAVPLVLAVLLASHRLGDWPSWQDAFGIATWLLGIAGAGLSDWQLRRFAAEPAHRGMVCDRGLWRWTRHPNYFFEWLGWAGVAIVAFDVASPNSFGWMAISAPVLMYWLLVHVSGIPPLEDHMIRTRGDTYKSYQRRTSRFVPLPPSS